MYFMYLSSDKLSVYSIINKQNRYPHLLQLCRLNVGLPTSNLSVMLILRWYKCVLNICCCWELSGDY